MKTTITIAAPALLFLAVFFSAVADAAESVMPDHLVSFYGQYIDQQAALEMEEASRYRGSSPSSICSAELHGAKADFYASSKEQLVQEMVAQEVGMQSHKIDYFLTSSFLSTDPREKIAACKLARPEG